MNAEPRLRPVGFAPSEISARVNTQVVSHHAEEAAFLWTMRNRAVTAPHYSLKDLAKLDERVEAHLAGLRVAADVGWKHCQASLENLGPGEVFALSVMAFGAGNRDRMREALLAGCSSPVARPGLVSALGWLAFGEISQWIGRLLQAKAPAHRTVGIRACVIHRRDPAATLAAAASDPDPGLRASAFRAVGELKRRDLANPVRAELNSEDESCRFWAAWALALLGERGGVSALTRWFERADSFGVRALQIGLRGMNLEESRGWISASVKRPELGRHCVMGVGIIGDPASIPWLIKRMESPDLARLAGEAFTMITGVDLAYDDLDHDAPPPVGATEAPIDAVLDLDYESNLPWPSPRRVEEWWQANQPAFSSGTRYLAGKPITPQSALEVLIAGKQRQRAAAALELALLDPDRILFEVRARGTCQEADLVSWTS